MSEVFILQWSEEIKSTDVVVCLLIWFICSSRCGVAAATLLAKDEPIKRSFQTEQMCALTDFTCKCSISSPNIHSRDSKLNMKNPHSEAMGFTHPLLA